MTSILPLLLVVTAAVMHALWNLMVKRASDAGAVFVAAYNAVACTVYVPVAVYIVWTGHMAWSWSVVACIVASALLHLSFSLCMVQGYRVADLSVVYPIARGTGPMLSSIGAFTLLGETPSPLGVLGLLAVIAGILLISTEGRLSKFRAPGATAGVTWGVITGAIIAGYSVVDAWSIKQLAIPPLVLVGLSNLLRFPMLIPNVLRDRAGVAVKMRGKWGLAVGVGIIAPLTYILVLWALRLGMPLSIAAPVREMSMMAAAILGMVVLRENVGIVRLAGCAVLTVGVVLLART